MSQQRIPELDGIRGLAILLVMVWHYLVVPCAISPASSLGGHIHRIGLVTWSGVDLFFVLSGFLIGGILIDAKGSSTYFRTFYIRRAFRILPIYIFYCGAGLALVALFPAWQRFLGRPMPWYLYTTFTQNIWLAHHDWDVYGAVTWSLAVEEQFYLTLPLIIYLVPRRRLAHVIAMLAGLSVILRAGLYLYYGGIWGTAAYTLMVCRADALMLGVLGALAVRDPGVKALLSAQPAILNTLLLLSGIGTAVLIWKGWGMSTRPMSTLGYTCVATFYLSLLLIAATRRGWIARLMRFRPLMEMGTIAYCAYLIHGLAFSAALGLVPARPDPLGPNWPAAVLGLVLTVVVGEISWRLFESKMVRFGHRYTYVRMRPQRSEAAVSALEASA